MAIVILLPKPPQIVITYQLAPWIYHFQNHDGSFRTLDGKTGPLM